MLPKISGNEDLEARALQVAREQPGVSEEEMGLFERIADVGRERWRGRPRPRQTPTQQQR